MALMSSPEAKQLLALARSSIEHGLQHGAPLRVNPDDYPEAFRPGRGCFVSLHRGRELRGCIGTLEPRVSLVEDVARCAWSAAHDDPRMDPVTEPELPLLTLSISILTVPEPLSVLSEAELLEQVRPGVDGLIVQEGSHRGTLLPVVWEALPDALDFVRTVKQKAGLPADYWSDELCWERYQAEEFHEAGTP